MGPDQSCHCGTAESNAIPEQWQSGCDPESDDAHEHQDLWAGGRHRVCVPPGPAHERRDILQREDHGEDAQDDGSLGYYRVSRCDAGRDS